MLEQSRGFIGRVLGAAVLRVSSTANAEDVAAARAIRWEEVQFGKVLSKMQADLSILNNFNNDYEETGSEIEVAQRALHRAGVSMIPLGDWQPENSKGQPIGALGELLTPTK